MNYLTRVSIAGLLALSIATGCASEPDASRESSHQTDELNLHAGGHTPIFDTAGMPGHGGTPASGGEVEQNPGDAESPDDCQFDGFAGQIAISCDSATVEFSQPVPIDGLMVKVKTDQGHEFEIGGSPDNRANRDEPNSNGLPVELRLTLSRDEQAAVGFKLFDRYGDDLYSPESLTVVVVSNEVKVADTTLTPTYTCNQVATSHWCWEGEPLRIEVSR